MATTLFWQWYHFLETKKKRSYWPINFLLLNFFRIFFDHQYISEEPLTTFSDFWLCRCAMNQLWWYMKQKWIFKELKYLKNCEFWNTLKLFIWIPFSIYNICVNNDKIRCHQYRIKIWFSLLGRLLRVSCLESRGFEVFQNLLYMYGNSSFCTTSWYRSLKLFDPFSVNNKNILEKFWSIMLFGQS